MNKGITADELEKLVKSEYEIIDIRDSSAFEYGHIDGAVNIPQDEVLSAELPKGKKLVICCRSGIISRDIADELCEKGFEAYNLEGGYVDWLRVKMENRQVTEAVELSLRKKFKKSIWCKFTKAINEYELVKPNDKIAVCISGGKDSMLTQSCFRSLKSTISSHLSLYFSLWTPATVPKTAALLRKMHVRCPYLCIFLSRISLTQSTISRKIPAISAHVCAADTSTATQRLSAATR